MLPQTDSDRSWPIPQRPWSMRMDWRDLLLMHYRVPVERLRRLVPPALKVDTFDGSAWLSIVPFRMTGVAPRLFPNIPGLSNFPELNVRTYVTINGKPGIWFFSLDAHNPVAVRLARSLFHLNYLDAKIAFKDSCQTCNGTWFCYRSNRTHRNQPAANLKCEYRPIGPDFRAQPNSLEWFLTARYCLYSADGHGRVYRGEIDHPPWVLREAQAIVTENSMADWLGIDLGNQTPLLHYCKHLHAVAWSLEPVEVPAEDQQHPQLVQANAM